jgi:hypothetical protein
LTQKGLVLTTTTRFYSFFKEPETKEQEDLIGFESPQHGISLKWKAKKDKTGIFLEENKYFCFFSFKTKSKKKK